MDCSIAQPQLKALYGDVDHRQNFFQMPDNDFLSEVKKCAKATACLIPSQFLVRKGDDWTLSPLTPSLVHLRQQGKKWVNRSDSLMNLLQE